MLLVEAGVSEATLLESLADAVGMDYVDLGDYPIDGAATAVIPEGMARRLGCLPIAFEDEALVVAMSDPTNVVAKDDLRAASGRDIRVVLSTHADIETSINRFHRVDESLDLLSESIEDSGATDTVEDITGAQQFGDEAPVVKLVNLLITQAVNDRASDIHIEPQERDVRIRFRIDGVLHDVMRSPRTIHAGVISRLKIMSDLDIAERRVSQSGRISVKMGGRAIDLRVESMPTVWGEKIALRVLDKSAGLMDLNDLGFSDANMERFMFAANRPYGCIICSGPTGSGKSTTLYATLNLLNGEDRNIITVEDPVEQRIKGLNQIQINRKAGMTFGSSLRSILRADPDIIMVGEMRDTETARLGIEAALTGHLVLSTIHTNSAPSVLTRLIDMGIEPFLVSSSIDCVIGQRLMRRLCSKCKQPYSPTIDQLRNAAWGGAESLTELPQLYKPIGCVACSKTGYSGRIAVHEIMLMSEEIERLVSERANADDLMKIAMGQGMTTMRHDALLKAAQGITSLEEVLRVTV